MEAWLQDTFKTVDGGLVIVFTDPVTNGAIGFDPANAATIFPSVAVVPTHAALSGLAIASEGWQKIFDQWKAKGIIT